MESRRLIFRIVVSCLIVIGFIVSVGFASHKQSEMPCSGISITIQDGPGCGFVEETDIKQIIQNKFGALEGRSLASINISMLEKIINTNPFIYDAEVFSTIDGKLNIDVKQRIPVLRVINYKNESFYIDQEGIFMPSSEKYTARVPVANGFIYDRETEKRVRVYDDSESHDTSIVKSKSDQLFHIIRFANRSEFWNAEVQQLYVNAEGDIEMIPRVGNHTVILGDDNDLDEKFTKLLAFYREGLNKKGWNKYSTINLKYKDQVVCTKNNMEKDEIVVGLDIGTTKICTIVGRKNEFGKIDILGYGKYESHGVTRGVVTNIVNTIESITKSVQEASEKSNVDIGQVYVGIAGQHIKSLQHRGMRTRDSLDDEIAQSDIDAIVEDMYKLAMPPGEKIIHVIPQEYIIDNEQGIKNPIGMSGIRLEANCHIITGQITAAKNIYKCVERAKLKTLGLFLEPLASSEAVLTEEEKEAGVVLVDIGGGTTDIAIFQDGIIRHTAVIPFGGNVITEDIKMGCSIIRLQAELLKIKFGSALASENQENEIVSIPGLRGRDPREISVKNLAHIIQARMEEIIEHVHFEIKNSGLEKKLIAGIVITGGGAQLRHIVQLVEFITGMDTRVGYPNEHLAKGSDELKSPMYATGVGLVIKGFHDMEKRKNIPTDIDEDSKKSPKRKDKVLQPKNDHKPSFFETLAGMFKEESDTEL